MHKNKYSIKDWAPEDRPREKLLQKGILSLSDAELLAILIGSGNRNETAVTLSQRILASTNNNLHALGKLSVSDLTKGFNGIGEAKAIAILAALELGRRRKLSDVLNKKQIGSSSDVFEVFSAILADLPHEEFWVLLLTRANKIIDKVRISQGGISSTTTDVKLIMKYAVDKLASAIIVCHNHPSGSLKPSTDDIVLTKKIKEAGKIFDLPLLDHIIVADNSYYSFADENAI